MKRRASADALPLVEDDELGVDVDPSWRDVIAPQLQRREGRLLLAFVAAARRGTTVYPRHDDVFTALRLTPLDKVRVCILGQDPYHGPGQAHGLAFSVPRGVPAPPSLRNILEEACGARSSRSGSGDLSGWARQGVLLLNTVLTVEKARPGSHAGRGWEDITTAILKHVSRSCPSVVFMLWGKPAQELRSCIENVDRHLILEAPHPSPLSAYRGFKGCGHFRDANAFLEKRGLGPIHWDVDYVPPKEHGT